MNLKSAYGAFVICNGVRFVFTQAQAPYKDYWDAGALACPVYENSNPQSVRDGYPWRTSGLASKTLDSAMRRAIANRVAEVAKARELVAAYDKAKGPRPLCEILGPVESVASCAP